MLSEMPLPVSATLISTYISHSTTDTAIFPPAGVYFTALSSRLKRASDVTCCHGKRSNPPAVHGHDDFLFLCSYTIPLMACATVSKRRPGFLSNWITPVSSRKFSQGLKEKVQLIRLAADSPDKVGALRLVIGFSSSVSVAIFRLLTGVFT